MQERNIIHFISSLATRENEYLRKGIGDDCAIVRQRAGMDQLFTADMLVENVHFDTSWHDPYLLGRKTFAVNISDVAAMGGMPRFALLSIGLSAKYDKQWIDRFMEGVLSILDEYHCILIGGDTVSAEQLTFSVTMIGDVTENMAVSRSGANPGDSIYVSGVLGSAAAGLHICQTENYSIEDTLRTRWPALLKRHLDPSPRVVLGDLLRKSGYLSAMQDISDGIATDLSHICTASRVRAVIDETALPADNELSAFCSVEKQSQVAFQIRGGEDYELLFVVRNSCEDKLEEFVAGNSDVPIHKIGEIYDGEGVSMLTSSGKEINIEYQGYEHSA